MSEFRIEQTIDAPPATVYRFLTQSDLWARWQGERASLDPRPGGRFLMEMGNGRTAEGRFVELVKDNKVVLTWGWVDHPDLPPGSTLVEILLNADGTGTHLVLTHRSLPRTEIERHAAGWRHYLPRLSEAAAGRTPTPDTGP